MAFLLSPDILRTSQWTAGRRYLFGPAPDSALLWPDGSYPRAPRALRLNASLGRRIAADLTEFSLPVLLRYEDRNTMAFGVESRVPFVDHSFVEWLATLPADMRLRHGWTKRILRDALVGVLPEPVRRRKTKLGFDTPQSAWLAGPLAGWLHEALSAPRHLDGVVDRNGVRRLFSRRVAGDSGVELEEQLFRLAIYESWARQFIEGARPPEPMAQRAS
jgi:asparagine synthase (glutamine-hydrolysing)